MKKRFSDGTVFRILSIIFLVFSLLFLIIDEHNHMNYFLGLAIYDLILSKL